jgi:peptide/nickel transport system substrate-binding protein
VANSSWILAIDFGTSFTVAAALVEGGSAQVLEVDGDRRVPSVILVDDDRIVVGRVADDMSITRPSQTLRAPKSRLGDPSPIVLGQRTYAIVPLVAALLERMYNGAVEEFGNAPREVRLTHPATWSRTRLARLLEAAALAGITNAVLVPEPIAAALSYWHRGELPVGGFVAVYDLGGGTFDTAILQAVEDGFRIVGRPDGDVSVGGELFDEIAANLIGNKLDPNVWEQIQLSTDRSWQQLGVALRNEARRAKETLSTYPYAEAPIPLPTGLMNVRLTREELESALAGHIADSVLLLRRCVDEAGITDRDLNSIQLVGGSSRIPAIEAAVRATFPAAAVHRRGDPKNSVALGALVVSPNAITPPPVRFGSSEDPPEKPAMSSIDVEPQPAKSLPIDPPAKPLAAPVLPVQAREAAPQTFLVAPSFAPPPVPPTVGKALSSGGANERRTSASRAKNRRIALVIAACLLVAAVAGVVIASQRGDHGNAASDTTLSIPETTSVDSAPPSSADVETTQVAPTTSAVVVIPPERTTAPPTTATATTAAATTTTAAAQPSGGTVRIGVDQEWGCMDWMGSCGGSTYGDWASLFFTTTRPFDFVQGSDGIWVYKASNLLTAEPTVTMSGGKQTVTYSINPAAVWNDGVPITSSDFKYTWSQVVSGSDVLDTSIYSDVESVDDSNPSIAVLNFSTPNGYWQDLFELDGLYPAHLLDGKDRAAETQDGYTWSAGPYQLVSWDRGVGATFERNPAYWGTKSQIDRIEETFFADTASEFNAFTAGEVDTIAPQPQLDAVDLIFAGGLPGQVVVDARAGGIDALWINNSAPPFDDLAVRRAIGYALDRNAIVSSVFSAIGVTTAVNSLNPPMVAAYSNQDAFSFYTLDLAMVDSIMTGAGYAKDASGIWAKGDAEVSFTLQTTLGNRRREQIVQVMQTQLLAAGFKIDIVEQKSSDLFATILPDGTYQLALYTQAATTLNPSLSTVMKSTDIPSADHAACCNWTHTSIAELDALLTTVDTATDAPTRADASKQADDIMADQAVSLPIAPLPTIGLYGARITGDFSPNAITGPWWNINTWTVAG